LLAGSNVLSRDDWVEVRDQDLGVKCSVFPRERT